MYLGCSLCGFSKHKQQSSGYKPPAGLYYEAQGQDAGRSVEYSTAGEVSSIAEEVMRTRPDKAFITLRDNEGVWHLIALAGEPGRYHPLNSLDSLWPNLVIGKG